MEHISNEEKAKHLSSREMYGGFTLAEQNAAYQAAMQAMEWKDEYYEKLLDLLVESGADADIITNYIKNCIEL